MNQTKLFQILDSLSSKELDQLHNFLISPYFSFDQSLSSLLSDLRKSKLVVQSGRAKDLDFKQSQFGRLFPGQVYSAKKLNYLYSDLNKATELFLAIESLQGDPVDLRLRQMQCLAERGLEKAFAYHLRQSNDQDERRGPKQLQQQYRQLELEESLFASSRRRTFDRTIEEVANTLDQYYFLQRLSLSCAMLDRQSIFQDKYRIGISPAWIQHIVYRDFFQSPLLSLYYRIYQALLQEEENEHFSQLKAELTHLEARLPSSELKNIYLFAINYCARKIRQGQESYVTEVLGLYEAGIAQSILLDRGELSPWTFANVIKLYLRLEEYDRAE
ncbi:MAG: hypothetical protein AAFY36_19210, partial [Bacteroidota bacterium]